MTWVYTAGFYSCFCTFDFGTNQNVYIKLLYCPVIFQYKHTHSDLITILHFVHGLFKCSNVRELFLLFPPLLSTLVSDSHNHYLAEERKYLASICMMFLNLQEMKMSLLYINSSRRPLLSYLQQKYRLWLSDTRGISPPPTTYLH